MTGTPPVTLADIADRRIVLWGAGLEAQGALLRLRSLGATDICVAVDRVGKNTALIDRMQALGEPVVVGDDAESALLAADFVVASPSIPPANPLWDRLGPHDTTTNLWLAEFGNRTVAITGSKGKSTTTAALGAVLQSVLDGVAVGGNIGIPFFELPTDSALFVVEVGSPQALRLTHSPRGGGITTLFPEHLDFHGSLHAYYAAKWNLFAHGSEFVVAGGESLRGAQAEAIALPIGPFVWPAPSEDLCFVSDSDAVVGGRHVGFELPHQLSGEHNRGNLLVALGIAARLGVDVADPRIADALHAFEGLEHRLQTVRSVHGVDWVDDSLSTAPQSAAAALAACSGRRVFLLVGGQDRGVDYAPLREALVRHGDVALVTIPDSGAAIADSVGPDAAREVLRTDTIEDAVRACAASAGAGDVVLFSPAAPSGSGYVDYRARSAAFVAAIDAL
jgi:UDP-N-acetylmuramoylalanine--D-glutamate ligase